MAHVTTVTKMCLFGSHSQVYCNNFLNTLSADFQSRVGLLFFTEVLPLALTKTANQNTHENLPSSAYYYHSNFKISEGFPTKSCHKASKAGVPKIFLLNTPE